jgi:hypothetical protein
MAYRRELWHIISGSEVRFMWNITTMMMKGHAWLTTLALTQSVCGFPLLWSHWHDLRIYEWFTVDVYTS